MAWSEELNEESISTLCDFIGVSRPEATRRLKAHNFDIDQAVNEYLEDPQSTKYKWDESVWTSDRDGTENPAGIQFNVQGPDVPSSFFEQSAAPTRPPSRTNSRSPLGGPATAAEEDADLQRALAESAAESGLPPQESGITGGDVHTKAFGPATRSEYEQDQWALVPTTSATTRDKSELPPSARKRLPSVPAFLYAKDSHRLGAIITILHAIPSARNVLLSSGRPANSYGYDSRWWKGQPILKRESLEALATGEWVDEVHRHPDFHEELHRLIAFLDNTERAYGAVDGLADSPAINPTWDNDIEENLFNVLRNENEDKIDTALKDLIFYAVTERVHWKRNLKGLAGQAIEDTDMSGSEDTSLSRSDSSDDEDKQARFNFLSANLEGGQNSWVTSLYDALDSVFWANALTEDNFPDESSNTAFITEPGEFLTVRIGGEGLCQPCDVPGVLYLDRYLESRKGIAIDTQTQIHFLRSRIQKARKREENIRICHGDVVCQTQNWYGRTPHPARDCLERTIKASETMIEKQQRRAQRRYTTKQIEQGHIPTFQDIALIHSGKSPYQLNEEEQQAEDVLEQGIRVSKGKLEEISEEEERIKAEIELCNFGLKHTSKRLTCHEKEAPPEFLEDYIAPGVQKFYSPEYWNPACKYFLRGVATTNEITYVCIRNPADLMTFDDQAQSLPKEQWWKLVYDPNESSPLTVEKTDLDTVLIAAGTESKHPIMIYASETAMEANPIEISDSLRMFIRADNRSFHNELSQEQSNQPEEEVRDQTRQSTQAATTIIDGPVPLTAEAVRIVPSDKFNYPAKRKHSDASSVATIDSTDSRNLELAFSETEDPSQSQTGDFATSFSHREYATPDSEARQLEEALALSRGQQYEPESPVLGRRAVAETQDQEMRDLDPRDVMLSKSPEMQERTGGPSMFAPRPVDKAPQAASVDLMDMDIKAEQLEK